MSENNPSYFAVIPANVRYDTKLKANEKLLYGEITVLTNKTGECWASNKYFADLYKVTTQAISKWILNLKNRGYITIQYIYKNDSKEIEKRIIRMVSTNVYEVSTSVDGGINKCCEGYQQMFKDNNTSINNTSNNILNSQLEEEFKILWKRYPNKKGNTKALDYYKKARKQGTTFEEVEQGINNYNKEISIKKTDKKYIKHGSTWFNNKCWLDDYEIKQEVDDSNAGEVKLVKLESGAFKLQV